MCRSIQTATCVPRSTIFAFLGSIYVRTTWNTFVGVSTCAPRGTHLFRRQVNICSRRCSLASGYDAGCIWSCGGCSDYFPVVPSLSPHLVPHVYTYLLRRYFHLLGEKFLGNTRVWFLACSSFPPLKSQSVLEFLVDWVAPHYRSDRQKLAFRNHAPTPSHINRRDIDSLRDLVCILAA